MGTAPMNKKSTSARLAYSQEQLIGKFGISPDPPYCCWFGCGRLLTAQERLYGNACSTHSGYSLTNKTLVAYLARIIGDLSDPDLPGLHKNQ